MTTKATHLIRLFPAKPLSLLAKGRSVAFLLFLIMYSGVWTISPSQIQAREVEPSACRSTNVPSNHYFLLKSFTNLQITKDCKLVVNSNLTLHENIQGGGILILSYPGGIFLNANEHKINALVVHQDTKVRLKGDIQIMRQLRILDKAEINLDGYDLILSLYVEKDFFENQIKDTGIGQINPLNEDDHLSVSQSFKSIPSATGMPTIKSFISPKQTCISLNTFFPDRKIIQLFLEKETPPPKGTSSL